MAKKVWTSKFSPIKEVDETEEISSQSRLGSLDSNPTEALNLTTSRQCGVCQAYGDLIMSEFRQHTPQQCYSYFHIMYRDFLQRQHLLSDLLQHNHTLTVRMYVTINMLKNILPATLDHHPSQVTRETLGWIEYLASSNSSTSTSFTTGQWVGRTTNNSLYYPYILKESFNTFTLNFNKIRSPQEAIQFHPWVTSKPRWLETYSHLLSNLTWKEFILVSFNSWITIPILRDTAGRLFADSSIIGTIASNHNLRIPKELPGLLTICYLEYLPEREVRIVEELYKGHLLELWRPGTAIGPLIPLPTFARGIELVECLISPTFGLQLFSPITGTLQILKQKVPFILIAGQIHLPYSIIKLIIPSTPGKLLITQQTPKQLCNWLLVHLVTAARISKFALSINPVIPLASLDLEGIPLRWNNIRTKSTLDKLISKLKQ